MAAEGDRPGNGRRAYRRAVDLAPRDARLLNNLARLLEIGRPPATGRFELAAKAVAVEPAFDAAWDTLAELRFRSGRRRHRGHRSRHRPQPPPRRDLPRAAHRCEAGTPWRRSLKKIRVVPRPGASQGQAHAASSATRATGARPPAPAPGSRPAPSAPPSEAATARRPPRPHPPPPPGVPRGHPRAGRRAARPDRRQRRQAQTPGGQEGVPAVRGIRAAVGGSWGAPRGLQAPVQGVGPQLHYHLAHLGPQAGSPDQVGPSVSPPRRPAARAAGHGRAPGRPPTGSPPRRPRLR
ncbi:MAG: hypothetical protein R3F43_21965 [bacterium]